MANTILITANWHTGALSQQTISRQYDNNRYVVQFVGYPEASDGNELDYYLLVWMSSAPGEKPDEIAPIQLASDQWYISNVFTQQTQQIKFQMCALNAEGTFEAHSPIFTGFVRNSLEHDGTTQDIDVSTLFDAYREYLNELIIRAGAVVIDSTPTQGSTNAVSSGGVYTALAGKVAKPITSPNGTNGQLLRTNGDGTTQWVDEGLPTDQQTATALSAWLEEHPEATTTVQDRSITKAKIEPAFLNNIENAVFCKSLGMNKNDVNLNNAVLLVDAINAGKTIFVDDLYRVEIPNEGIETTADIRLFGMNVQYGFNFTGGGKLFKVAGNISAYFENLTFSANDYLATIAVVSESSYKIANFVTDGCAFYNKVKLADFRGTIDVDPTSGDFGISDLRIINNYVSGNYTFFASFVDYPVTHAEITGNTIKNLDHVFFYCAINNNNTFDQELILSNQYCHVANNYVKNDYDFWGNVNAGNYYCFVLFEDSQLDYENNHVEGLHCLNNCVVYDVYPHASNVFYHNNTNINNAQFYNGVVNHTFIKLKGITNEAIFSDSVFRIEDDYAENVGQTGFEIAAYIWDIPANIYPSIKITNCYIYGQTIAPTGFRKEVKRFDFINNTVLCKVWNDGPLWTGVHGISESVDISRNKFLINIATTSINNYGFMLAYGADYSTGILESFIAKDNTIQIKTIDNGEHTASYPLIFGINAKAFIVKGLCYTSDAITGNAGYNDGLLRDVYATDVFDISDIVASNASVDFGITLKGQPLINQTYTAKVQIKARESKTSSEYIYLYNIDNFSTGQTSILRTWDVVIATPTGTRKVFAEMLVYKDGNDTKYKLTKDNTVIYDAIRPESQTDYILIDDTALSLKIRLRALTSTSKDQVMLRYANTPKNTILDMTEKSIIGVE